MTRATGAEFLTGIRGLRRSTTGEPGAKLRSPGRRTAAVLSRAGRTSPGAGQTSSKAVRMQASEVVLTGEGVPSAAWTVAAVRRVI